MEKLQHPYPLTVKAAEIFNKYLRKRPDGEPAESIETSFARVAMGIAAHDTNPPGFYEELREEMINLRFLPNRPAWYGVGRNYGFTSACTFLEMEDSLIKGERSIMNTLKNAVAIQQAGACEFDGGVL